MLSASEIAESQFNRKLDACLTFPVDFNLDIGIITPMAKETYKQALDNALRELSDLINERDKLDEKRDELDKRIRELREGLSGLAILCETNTNKLAESHPQLFPDLIPPDMGLTDAIRTALQVKRIFYSPVEVRDQLEYLLYDLSKYKHVLPSIHTILKRLVDSKEVEPGNRDGQVVYRWRGPNSDAFTKLLGLSGAKNIGKRKKKE